MLKIKILKDEVVWSGRYIQTIRRHFSDRSGKIKTWEMVKRKIFRNIVAIAPLTPKNELILVQIYRIPLKKYVIELCAGLTDKKDESEAKAIRRELLEETGYTVSRIEKLIAGPYSSGLADTEMTIYLGLGAKKITKPRLEESEDIQVLKIPLKKAYRFLAHPSRGVKVDLKTLGLLSLLAKKGYSV